VQQKEQQQQHQEGEAVKVELQAINQSRKQCSFKYTNFANMKCCVIIPLMLVAIARK